MLIPPWVNFASFAYANAFEFGPRDFATGRISPLPLNFPPIELTAPNGLTFGFAPNF